MTTSNRRAWILFVCGLLLFAAARATATFAGFDCPYVWWALADLLVLFAVPAFSVAMEMSLFPMLYLLIALLLPGEIEGSWVSFPLAVMSLSMLSHALRSRLATLLTVAGALVWLDLPALVAEPPTGWLAWTLIGAGLLGLALTASLDKRPPRPLRNIDLLLCSYTGNTAHFAGAFAAAAASAKTRITEHRFHYHKDFAPELDGDALVIAYPVAGWNPFWPLLEYLLFRLPRGDGKAAFLLSTSAGGPENAHLVPWLALRARGYRVLGRLGATYPVNVPIMRMGSHRSWRILDSLLPRGSDLKLVAAAARAFREGRPSGLACTFFPFPLFILGPLTYNRIVNYIYRGYSLKRMCNDCGLCIRYCPTERLFMKNGRVRSKGTCALCFGCVNLCPTDAMQIALLTELGNAYPPRWPKLVLKRKPKAKKK